MYNPLLNSILLLQGAINWVPSFWSVAIISRCRNTVHMKTVSTFSCTPYFFVALKNVKQQFPGVLVRAIHDDTAFLGDKESIFSEGGRAAAACDRPRQRRQRTLPGQRRRRTDSRRAEAAVAICDDIHHLVADISEHSSHAAFSMASYSCMRRADFLAGAIHLG
jgi:hypothetical protein